MQALGSHLMNHSGEMGEQLNVSSLLLHLNVIVFRPSKLQNKADFSPNGMALLFIKGNAFCFNFLF